MPGGAGGDKDMMGLCKCTVCVCGGVVSLLAGVIFALKWYFQAQSESLDSLFKMGFKTSALKEPNLGHS